MIVYQEQVMRVAQALAGYTLQEADMLRAAMVKNKAVMESERARFIEGAVRAVSKSRWRNRSSKRSKPSPHTVSTARMRPHTR